MEQPQSLKMVAEFHRTFGHPILAEPAIPAAERCALRIALLREELDELADAIAANDLTEVADALCDLQYVLSGAILEFGMGDRFKALFEEVQRSNMSKTCASEAEAEATAAYYRDERGEEAYIRQVDGHWLVFRKSDDKTLKSINYSPADLQQILAGSGA